MQKKNALMQEILVRQKETLNLVNQAELLLPNIRLFCRGYKGTEHGASTGKVNFDVEVAEQTFSKFLDLYTALDSINKLMYSISQTAVLFPNNQFDLDEGYLYNIENAYNFEVLSNISPAHTARNYKESLYLFVQLYRSDIHAEASEEWKAWINDKVKNPPKGLFEDDYFIFSIIKDPEENRFTSLFENILRLEVYLLQIKNALRDVPQYVYGDIFDVHSSLDSYEEQVYKVHASLIHIDIFLNPKNACEMGIVDSFYNGFYQQSLKLGLIPSNVEDPDQRFDIWKNNFVDWHKNLKRYLSILR